MLAFAFATACLASGAGTPSPDERKALTTGFFAQLRTFADRDGITNHVGNGLEVTIRELALDPGKGDLTSSSTLDLEESPPFRELFASWNIETPAGTGFGIEVRVGEKRDGPLSPWLWLGDWGEIPAVEKLRKCDAGHIDVDTFVSDHDLGVWQLRIRDFRADDGKEPLRVRRIDVCIANRTLTKSDAWHTRPEAEWQRVLNTGCTMPPPSGPRLPGGPVIPFRSQRDEEASIASRICSPTSVAMLLAHRGVDVPTAQVAARLYDAEHAMYGNWSRAVQGAFSFGVPGYLTRIATWDEAERLVLGQSQPLVISIAAKKGELTGAPYAKTDGHLLVLRGFDTNGDVFVNDPAAQDAEHGVTKYCRAELERCWMGHGGVAYVLLPRAKAAESADKPR